MDDLAKNQMEFASESTLAVFEPLDIFYGVLCVPSSNTACTALTKKPVTVAMCIEGDLGFFCCRCTCCVVWYTNSYWQQGCEGGSVRDTEVFSGTEWTCGSTVQSQVRANVFCVLFLLHRLYIYICCNTWYICLFCAVSTEKSALRFWVTWIRSWRSRKIRERKRENQSLLCNFLQCVVLLCMVLFAKNLCGVMSNHGSPVERSAWRTRWRRHD